MVKFWGCLCRGFVIVVVDDKATELNFLVALKRRLYSAFYNWTVNDHDRICFDSWFTIRRVYRLVVSSYWRFE